MPIYEYRCSSCGFQKEFLQKIGDAPLTDCPECHAKSLAKLLSAPGFHLKGSGWYATDFKGKNPSKPVSAEPEAGTTATPTVAPSATPPTPSAGPAESKASAEVK